MKSREKILAIAVAALVVAWGLNAGYSYVDEAFTQKQNRLDTLSKQIDDKQVEVKKGMQARKSIAGWQQQSLPAERQVAGSLYQNWLLQIAEKAGVKNVNLTQEAAKYSPSSLQRLPGRAPAAPAYEAVAYKLEGDATLKQLVRLLYEFYSANHLQRISYLDISPARSGGDLALKINIQALILPGAKGVDRLNQEKSARLALGDLAAYEKAIVGRNLFAEYTPPKPVVVDRRPEPPRVDPPKPAFDHAKHATVTGIVEKDREPQLWLSVKTTGQELKLAEGEEFSVGNMKCKVIRINLRDAELATGDRHFLIKLQENLRDAATAKSNEL